MSRSPFRVTPRFSALVLCAMLLCVRHASSFAAEAAAFPRVTEVRVGIASAYQAGRWTPVVVTLEGGADDFAGQFFLTTVDGDGAPYRVPAFAQSPASADGRRELIFYFRPAALDNELGLQMVHADGSLRNEAFSIDDERATLRVPRAMPANERLVVSVGPPLGLTTAFAQSQDLTGGTRPIELAQVTDLPAHALGWDGIDTLFVNTEDAALNATWTRQPERAEALATWVRQGGRLVLPIGREAETLLGAEHPLAQFIPGQYAGQVALLASQTSVWEDYAASPQPLPPLRTATGEERLQVPNVTGLRGKVETPTNLGAGQPPLVVRLPHGLGEVVYVAADLSQPPFAKWSGRNNLLRRFTRSALMGESIAGNTGNRTAIQQDLVEQLRRALDDFPGVSLAPFLWVTMLVVGYVALVGPGDYGFLRRLTGRMEWTWFTFPLLVVAASAGGYWFACHLKGSQLRVNQFDIIDVDGDGAARGVSVANLFSPEANAYQLAMQPALGGALKIDNPTVRMSAFALAPAAFSGDPNRSTVQPLASDAYAFDQQLDVMQGLPMQIWSSKTVMAEWRGTVQKLASANLTHGGDGLPEGQLTWHAPWALDDCWLVYGNTVTRLGRLVANEPATVGSRSGEGWSTLSNLLRYQRRVQRSPGKEEYTMVGTQWDAESTDVKEILRQILFYDAAGGSEYSHSWNGALRQLDLSARRDLGQAMLVGFVAEPLAKDAPGAVLHHNGQPLRGEDERRWVVVRTLLPVSPIAPVAPAAASTSPDSSPAPSP
ncbi:MAG: hypothetical protein SGJ19_28055 [Planctomycetia bacterium]|nr:hypothetical protein [Planctomycetia bacterium]